MNENKAEFWNEMMVQDGTGRANVHQRSFVTRLVGKHLGYDSVPPLHYLTVGQGRRIAENFDADPGEIDRRGGLGGTVVSVMLPVVAVLLVVVGLLYMPWGMFLVAAVLAVVGVNLYSRSTVEYPFGPEGSGPPSTDPDTLVLGHNDARPAALPPEDWTNIIDVEPYEQTP